MSNSGASSRNGGFLEYAPSQGELKPLNPDEEYQTTRIAVEKMSNVCRTRTRRETSHPSYYICMLCRATTSATKSLERCGVVTLNHTGTQGFTHLAIISYISIRQPQSKPRANYPSSQPNTLLTARRIRRPQKTFDAPPEGFKTRTTEILPLEQQV